MPRHLRVAATGVPAARPAERRVLGFLIHAGGQENAARVAARLGIAEAEAEACLAALVLKRRAVAYTYPEGTYYAVN